MPRTYKPRPGSTKMYKKHLMETIQSAIQEVQGGLSLRKAAEKFGIHYSVIYRHMKRGNKMKTHGGQTLLSLQEEKLLVDRLQLCGEWGYPIDSFTLRLVVKDFLDRQGKTIKKFKENMPGPDFVYSFLRRHKEALSMRMCQNIKRSRAAITPETINDYFDRLEEELKDIPPENIVNFDETNLCDDPGRRKVIMRRGCKYPERIINSTKASTSVMFAGAADGSILPPYVVYKALHLYQSWREGGPKYARYNRTKSGWFDSYCFEDWVETVAIPYFKRQSGKKFLIGDNLSSHLSVETIKMCKENNISFIFLPSNSTHLTQPLDVAFFRPMKIIWRRILETWKKGPGRTEATIPKDKFPGLLKKLCDQLKGENITAGFKKCGIVPVSRNQVLRMLPSIGATRETHEQANTDEAMDSSFLELLKSMRHDDIPKTRKKRMKIVVVPGKSVGLPADSDSAGESDFQDPGPSTSAGPISKDDAGDKLKNVSAGSKRKEKCVLYSSSESSDYSLQDTTDNDEDSFIMSSEEKEADSVSNGHTSLIPGDFAVVKVYGKTKESCRLYVAKVSHPTDGGYVGLFYKRTYQTMKFSAIPEESYYFSYEDIVRKLSDPITNCSSRFKDMISFPDDLNDLSIF